MKTIILLINLIFLGNILPVYSGSCEDFVAANKSLGQEKAVYMQKKSQAQATKIRKSSLLVALLLEKCMEENPRVKGSQQYLEETYMMAKYFMDGEKPEDAEKYFKLCMSYASSKTLLLGNANLYDKALFFYQMCRESVHEEGQIHYLERIEYRGKGTPFVTVTSLTPESSYPYLSEELETLQNRVYTMSDSVRAMAALSKWSPKGSYYFNPPYLLIAGPDMGDKYSNETEALREVYKQTIAPAHDRLTREYFSSLTANTHIIPVYIVGSEYTSDGFKTFTNYTKKVHMRPCGNRIGYYNPYDKSLMVWLSSGEGTLVHELTHALMDVHYPNPPHWLAEGISALQEQTYQGKPMNNWRLNYIDFTLSKFKSYIKVTELLKAEADGTGYHDVMLDAYSRYFCLFLYEQKVLFAVYKEMAAGNLQDGQSVVLKRLNVSVEELQRQWECWMNGQVKGGVKASLEYRSNVKGYVDAQTKFPFTLSPPVTSENCLEKPLEVPVEDFFEGQRQMEQGDQPMPFDGQLEQRIQPSNSGGGQLEQRVQPPGSGDRNEGQRPVKPGDIE